MIECEIKPIKYEQTLDWLLNKHYAHRIPMITWAFGLFIENELRGICTFGKPASMSLCDGVCGKEYRLKVYELNRLVIDDGLPKNILSYFVSRCLKELKEEDLIIVSYADEGMNHCGFIYQATNWLYTGKNKIRTDKYMPGNRHARHYTDEFSNLRKVRTVKHRYIYFTGKSKKLYLNALKYKIQEYPKLDPIRYKFGDKKMEKIINNETGEIIYE